MERVRKVLAGLLLAVVVGAPAAASWSGLLDVGRDWLGLSGGWEVLVPLTVDAAAVYCAALAMRAVLAKDSAVLERGLVWVYALASAALQVWHAESPQRAVILAGASVSAAVLWDRTLRASRRDALRAVGAIEAPLPRFRALRWLVAPAETGRAWRAAVVHGLTSPGEALELVRSRQAVIRVEAPAEPVTAVAAANAPSSRAPVEGPELHELPELLDLDVRALPDFGDQDQADDVQGDDAQSVQSADEADDEAERERSARLADGWLVARDRGTESAGTDRVSAGTDLVFVPPEGAGAVVVETGDAEPRPDAADAELAATASKREALIVAWRHLGVVGVPETADVPAAVRWLAERGLTCNVSGAYAVRREMERSATAVPARLELLAGGAR